MLEHFPIFKENTFLVQIRSDLWKLHSLVAAVVLLAQFNWIEFQSKCHVNFEFVVECLFKIFFLKQCKFELNVKQKDPSTSEQFYNSLVVEVNLFSFQNYKQFNWDFKLIYPQASVVIDIYSMSYWYEVIF